MLKTRAGDVIGDNLPGNSTTIQLITAGEFREIFGGISAMTEWRWRQRFSDFPEPLKINSRNYYRLRDVETFLAAREVKNTAA